MRLINYPPNKYMTVETEADGFWESWNGDKSLLSECDQPVISNGDQSLLVPISRNRDSEALRLDGCRLYPIGAASPFPAHFFFPFSLEFDPAKVTMMMTIMIWKWNKSSDMGRKRL